MSTLNVLSLGRGEVLSPFSSYARKRMKRPFFSGFSSQRLLVLHTFSSSLKAMTQVRRAALTFVLCLLALTVGALCPPAQAQTAPGDWAWVNGSSTLGAPPATYPVITSQSGTWGTLGQASPKNNPGSRQYATTWTDSSGNLWLFGGGGNDSAGNPGYLNDLWEYSPTKGWTWVSGSNVFDGTTNNFGNNDGNRPGVYGTQQGVAAPGIVPGGRKAASGWTDASGNLWLFGGFGCDSTDANCYVPLNDLWEFNPSTGLWTWVSGSSTALDNYDGQPGVYGTKGIPNSANVPAGRSDAVSWIDSSGNLWLFGGFGWGNKSISSIYFNDLWEFTPSITTSAITGVWTWMSGTNPPFSDSDPTCTSSAANCYQLGVYTPQGSTSLVPGSRQDAVGWIDSNDNLWLFGGYYIDGNLNTNDFNDLWKFNSTTGQWTWMSGSNINADDDIGSGAHQGKPGKYGTQNVSDPSNVPGSRDSANGWIDSSGNLWLFGGEGYDSTGTYGGSTAGGLNDLWEFTPSTGNWTWVGGSKTGSYCFNNGTLCGMDAYYGVKGMSGAQGVAAVSNVPGSRYSAGNWADSSGNLWLFGGMGASTDIYFVGANNDQWSLGGIGYLNDLWEFQFTVPTAALPAFSTPSGTYIGAQSVEISDSTAGATIYYTTNGTAPTTTNYSGSGASPLTVSVASTEKLRAIAAAPNYNSSYVTSASYTIQNAAATPAFNLTGGTYGGTQSVTITDSTPGATIYYTTNGSTPSTSSYSGYGNSPILLTVASSETVEAIASATGDLNSGVASETYTILPLAATPVISPGTGTYGSYPSVTINDSNPGATIYYTTNGLTPTSGSSSCTAPCSLTVTTSETLEAIASASGYYPSATASATYTLNLPVPTISSISPLYVNAGTTFTLTVNGSNFTPLSTIYWNPARTGFTALTTTYVSSTQLTTQISAIMQSTSSLYEQDAVTVETPGAATTNAFYFAVESPNSSSFPVTISPAAATVTAGSSATISLAFKNAVSGSVIGCLNLPTGASCTYVDNPNSVNSGVLTIATSSTTPKGIYVITIVGSETVPVATSSSVASTTGLLLSALLLPLGLLRRKVRMKARSVWLTMCMGLVLLASAAFLTSCSNVSTSEPKTYSSTTKASCAGTVTLTVR